MADFAVACVIHRPVDKVGSIYIPDDGDYYDKDGHVKYDAGYTLAKRRPCVGTVLAKGQSVRDVSQGSDVIVSVGDGKWFDGFIGCGVYIPEQVRLYGLVNVAGKAYIQKIEECILAQIEGGRFRPINTNYLILRSSPQKKTEGGIYLSSDSQERDHKAVILDKGNHAHSWNIGDEVVYSAADYTWLNVIDDEELAGKFMSCYNISQDRLEDVAIVSESGILCRV